MGNLHMARKFIRVFPRIKQPGAGQAGLARTQSIAAAAGGVADAVMQGETGFIVPDGDTAAIAAKRHGLSVILVNPTGFLGGMSASGLGATDFLGQHKTFGGITSEFYEGINAAYGKKHVRSFDLTIKKAVALAPNNLEIRFLRFSIQDQLPTYLGYSKELAVDKKMILQQIQSQKVDVPATFKKDMKAVLLNSKTLSIAEKKIIEKI